MVYNLMDRGYDPSGIWGRGTRGWGDFASVLGVISQFQQNPTLPDSVEETFADMFLNWVYRITSANGGPIISQQVCSSFTTLGTWFGFRNIWFGGTFDTGLSGNILFNWTHTQIDSLVK